MKIEIAAAPAAEVRAAFAHHEVIRVDGDVVGAITALAPTVPDPYWTWFIISGGDFRAGAERQLSDATAAALRAIADLKAFGHETR